MPRLASVLVLLGAGAALLWMANSGMRDGELRAGTSLFVPYRPTRAGNPLAFYFYLTLYLCGGLAACVWALLALLGMAPPLRWR